MASMRDRIQQAKKEFAEQESKKGLSDQDLAQYGRKVLDESFGTKRIRLYENCYVRVSNALLGGGDFERLLGISGSADVQKKTGIGRFAAGLATGGNNLLVTGNRRGDIYLTIATEQKTHQIHLEASGVFSKDTLTSMHKIVTTAESLLSRTVSSNENKSVGTVDAVEVSETRSLADELLKLTELLSQGLITEEEFAQAKSKLLS